MPLPDVGRDINYFSGPVLPSFRVVLEWQSPGCLDQASRVPSLNGDDAPQLLAFRTGCKRPSCPDTCFKRLQSISVGGPLETIPCCQGFSSPPLLLLGCGAAFCSVGGCCALLPAVCRATCPPDSTRLEISRSDVHSRDMSVPVALLGVGALLTCARRHG